MFSGIGLANQLVCDSNPFVGLIWTAELRYG